jgi:hypothetical protein
MISLNSLKFENHYSTAALWDFFKQPERVGLHCEDLGPH